ncbi:hypothetical protein L208DRAFT_573082 [Tricholoma matsutake]|nr:hypothetical protein L208DRAFT_573082 [Tricholoma matsutake 945]
MDRKEVSKTTKKDEKKRENIHGDMRRESGSRIPLCLHHQSFPVKKGGERVRGEAGDGAGSLPHLCTPLPLSSLLLLLLSSAFPLLLPFFLPFPPLWHICFVITTGNLFFFCFGSPHISR